MSFFLSWQRSKGPGVVLGVLVILLAAISAFFLIRFGQGQMELRPHPWAGVSISESLQKAGIRVELMTRPFGTLLFLGGEVAGREEMVLAASDTLEKNGFEVYLIVPVGSRLIGAEKPHRHVIVDTDGRIRDSFGVGRSGASFLFFQQAGAVSWGQRSGVMVERLGRELKAWSSNLLTGPRPEMSPDTAGERWTERLADFPFDSLLAHAEDFKVNLDRLARGRLRVERTIGEKEVPPPGEPVFASICDLAVDDSGRVFVCDAGEGAIFVLSAEGVLRKRLGRRGQGPGEMSKPAAVAIHGSRLIVAEACCRLHEFGADLRYRRTVSWPVEASAPMRGWALLGAVVMVAQPPLPPQRSQVVQLYNIRAPQPYPMASFLRPAKPLTRTRDPVGVYAALASRNMSTLATDGTRYLAVYRVAERQVLVWDLATRRARRWLLIGHNLRTKVERNADWPSYATRGIVRGMAFDGVSRLYSLLPDYGVLVIDVPGARPLVVYELENDENEPKRVDLFTHIQVSGTRVYLLSPFLSQLTICSLVDGQPR